MLLDFEISKKKLNNSEERKIWIVTALYIVHCREIRIPNRKLLIISVSSIETCRFCSTEKKFCLPNRDNASKCQASIRCNSYSKLKQNGSAALLLHRVLLNSLGGNCLYCFGRFILDKRHYIFDSKLFQNSTFHLFIVLPAHPTFT